MSAEYVRALLAHAVAFTLGLPLWLLATSAALGDTATPGELMARVAIGGASFVIASAGGVWLHDRMSAPRGHRCQLGRRA